MADLAYKVGSLGGILRVDENGNLLVNSNQSATVNGYEIGPFGRILAVDDNGHLLIKKE